MNKVINGDALEQLKILPDKLVNCIVTSPPYWGLRNYGVTGQIGMEKNPQDYVMKIVEIFREARRVLKDDGTFWLNLGDTCYNQRGENNRKSEVLQTRRKAHQNIFSRPNELKVDGLKNKDLVGIPWTVAIALRNDGWYLRQDIIWHKPNPMPESVIDRPTKSHEYIFLFSKQKQYFYDYKSIREPWVSGRVDMAKLGKPRSGSAYLQQENIADNSHKQELVNKATYKGFNKRWKQNLPVEMLRNKRSVWTVPTHKYKGAHFATFPPKLITPCILAGCPKDGIVLDPFAGSGTTLFVARELGRSYIGIELNLEYVSLIEKRLEQQVLL